jgi:hypothetical protein
MTRKLFHSLTIPLLAVFATQGRLRMAQCPSFNVESRELYHGFLYDKGTFTAINFPGADATPTVAIPMETSSALMGTEKDFMDFFIKMGRTHL